MGVTHQGKAERLASLQEERVNAHIARTIRQLREDAGLILDSEIRKRAQVGRGFRGCLKSQRYEPKTTTAAKRRKAIARGEWRHQQSRIE
jgi:hypothetical protein